MTATAICETGNIPVSEVPHLATTPVHFARILVATDFSPQADQALKTAYDLARIFGSQLYLVHAIDPMVIAATQVGPAPAEVMQSTLDTAQSRLRGLVLSDPRLKKMQPRLNVGFSTPLDLIHEVTHRENIDLVVVGSHGLKGMERLALGSVAEAILRKSTCPVLIVGPQCKAEADPLCSILLATDLAPTGLRAAQYAASLAESAHGKLTVLHADEGSSTWPFLPSEIACDRAEGSELTQLLPIDIFEHCKPRFRVECGDPADVIPIVAEEECASLVVVGLRDRSALADRAPWSTLSRLIRDLHCPVLGVRGHLA